MRRLRVGVVVLALVIAACSDDSGTTLLDLAGARRERGTASFVLYVHCGVIGTMLFERWWTADPVLDDGQGNPPPGWGNPAQPGTLRFLDDDTAVFTARAVAPSSTPLPVVTFHRTAADEAPFACA